MTIGQPWYDKRNLVNVVVVFFLVCSCFVVRTTYAANCAVSNSSKLNCGYDGITQGQCESKGCCWQPVGGNSQIPWCFYTSGYNLCNLNTNSKVTAGPPFTPQQVSLMRSFFLNNIDIAGSGCVLASPDRNVPGGGSYYFHWARDGALSMNTLLLTSNNQSEINYYFPRYVKWVVNVLSQSDPNGIDIRTEPKFNIPSGSVFTGGWCRPQTDGPGLRAITLINFATYLINQGQTSYISEYLWTGNSNYNGGAIKYDLDWIVNNWSQNTCDLWEEVQSTDFFWNRITMKYSLLLGAAFAQSFGQNSNLAKTYSSVAAQISSTLGNHYNGEYVYESTNRQKDAAVICGFNDGYAGDGMFSPTDPRVAATITTLSNLFCSAFPINQQDTQNGIPGILYGRYEGDSYSGGNPWILLSAALAELYYRGASEAIEKKFVPERDDFNKYWKFILGMNEEEYDGLNHMQFGQYLANTGDGVLQRIAYHVAGAGYHLSEQLNKNSGYEQSATDLTWSYATVLKAMYYRDAFYAK